MQSQKQETQSDKSRKSNSNHSRVKSKHILKQQMNSNKNVNTVSNSHQAK